MVVDANVVEAASEVLAGWSARIAADEQRVLGDTKGFVERR